MISRRDILQRFAMLTGSVAFGVGTRHSDEDWLVEPQEAKELGVNLADCFDYYDNGFLSYREGVVNLIFGFGKDFRARWMKAHEHCVIERPRQRARRIRIFRHYLYGEAMT